MNSKLTLYLVAGLSIFVSGTAFAQAKAGEACGPGIKAECASGLFCAHEAGDCGKSESTGKCEAKAEICPQIFMPVCGCDGKTYGNDCAAKAAGQSIAEKRACSANTPPAIPKPDVNTDTASKELPLPSTQSHPSQDVK